MLPLHHAPILSGHQESNPGRWSQFPASYTLNDKSISELHGKGKMLISHYKISASLAEIMSGGAFLDPPGGIMGVSPAGGTYFGTPDRLDRAIVG